MSSNFPARPEQLTERKRFAIVASEYNRIYVDGLASHAIEELKIIAPQADVTTVRVPGSFEIPIAVQSVARYQNPDAILAFGVIFDGETLHASLIATVVKNDEQAKARCLSPEINRGTEAARAAARILQALDQIRKGA